MNSKLYAIISISLLLPACFFITPKKKGDKHTFFIQMPLDNTVIKNIQNALKPVVNNIIQEELGIEQDNNFPIFYFKKRQAITIYYVRDLYDNNEPLQGLLYLFLEPALDSLGKLSAPQNVTLTPKLDFFGEEKKGLFATIDLVALIADPYEELSFLNKEMKKTTHHANKEYKRAYYIDLYDIDKSEKYPYLPHISFGELRMNYLKHLVKDAPQADKILERIKQRIIQAVSDAISGQNPDDRKLSFDKLTIYDAKKRKYIHEHTLEQMS